VSATPAVAPADAAAGPATARYLRRRLPWYSFLYMLLGAQGTFWLWLIAIFACWWTAKPTLQRLSNRQAETGVSVVRAGAGESQRWVEVEGLELRLDRRLLRNAVRDPRREPHLPPVPLLVDPSDRTVVEFWTKALRLANAAAAKRDRDSEERRDFRRHITSLDDQDPIKLASYVPARCLLLQSKAPPPLSAGAAEPALDESKYDEFVDRQVDLVRSCVHPDRKIRGVLVEAPPAIVDRIRGELGVTVAPLLLQEDREPRDLETYIFAGAAITLLFLAAGFRGAMRSA
jgi:hypothetical protein